MGHVTKAVVAEHMNPPVNCAQVSHSPPEPTTYACHAARQGSVPSVPVRVKGRYASPSTLRRPLRGTIVQPPPLIPLHHMCAAPARLRESERDT